MAASARLDYVAPWWTYWLHNFPHLDLSFKPVDGTFRPEQGNYQQVGTRLCIARPEKSAHCLARDGFRPARFLLLHLSLDRAGYLRVIVFLHFMIDMMLLSKVTLQAVSGKLHGGNCRELSAPKSRVAEPPPK